MTIKKVTSYFDDGIKMLTAAEAAEKLSVKAGIVRRYCREGRLGQLEGKVWLIAPAELERFKAIPRRRGNPNFGKR
jgi:predicted site-specific integrase-resolvase